MKDTTTAPALSRETIELAAAACEGQPSDSYRHDAENDGLPLTTGGQFDEIGWLLFLGIGAAVIAAVFFAAGAVLL